MQQTWEREEELGEENKLVQDMQRELQKNRQKKAVGAADLLLFPIRKGPHWYLIELDKENERVLVYDSQVPADEHVRAGRNRVAERIRDWYQQGEAAASGWEVRWEQVPQQENDEDCGVAVLMAMRRRVLSPC